MRKLLIFFLAVFLGTRIDRTPLALQDACSLAITVEVRGELNNPGLFELTAPATVETLLKQLDLKDTCSLDTLSLQHVLSDGEIIVLPKKSDMETTVSINGAGLEELMTLPGIGEVMAQRIIDYREAHGGFQSLEELMEIPGIKTAKFAKLKDRIRL